MSHCGHQSFQADEGGGHQTGPADRRRDRVVGLASPFLRFVGGEKRAGKTSEADQNHVTLLHFHGIAAKRVEMAAWQHGSLQSSEILVSFPSEMISYDNPSSTSRDLWIEREHADFPYVHHGMLLFIASDVLSQPHTSCSQHAS